MDKLGKRQIEASQTVISKATLQANQDINFYRQKNEKLQKDSRIADEARRQDRFTQIQEESATSTKKYTALQMKNAELKEEEDCEKLFKEIEGQKRLFDQISGAKKKIIQKFEQELKKKDDDYGKMLKEQARDIREMVAKMRQQFFKLRQLNLEELKQIQKKFDQERKLYIEKMIRKIDQLLDKHTQMEFESAESRRKTEDAFVHSIDSLRIQGAKEYTENKIRIERQIQDLEKCFEQMRALYQLNTQKLEYNLKVLTEKNSQNKKSEDSLKRKHSFLINKLRSLKKDLEQNNQIFRDDNKKLTQNYKRITKQFKQLQKKFKHFEKADLDRYSQIQAMNEKEVEALEKKIIACDKTIHLQQLGVQWVGNPQRQEREKINIPVPEENVNEEVSLVIGQQKLGQVLQIVLRQADFIFDDKMREELEGKPAIVKLKSKLDLLKKTLQIQTVQQLNIFFQEIANKTHYLSEKEKKEREEERTQKEKELKEEEQKISKKKGRKQDPKDKEKEEPKKEEIPPPPQQQKVDVRSDFKVQPTMVVDFLNYWMASKDQRKTYLQKIAKKSAKQVSQREKKQKIAREGKKYWQKLTEVLPKRTFRMWGLLDKLLSKYHQVLISRHKLIQDTGQLNSQNEELKNLLHQYLQINHELIVPPTRLIRVQDQ